MEPLLSFFNLFQKSFLATGPFFLLLGVLIFIHELGHFLAARYFGVRVEVFSLGFGPKILKYKKGDTLYCLSLLPLGGYVKMFGDNPLEKLSDKEKEKGFLYKKVHQKWLIAFAGPFMNLIFTLFAFFLLALLDLPSLSPKLGDIQKNSVAYQTGFRSGDTVLSINNKPISYLEDLRKIIAKSPIDTLSFKVRNQNKEIKFLEATTSLTKNPNPLEWDQSIRTIEGFNFLSTGLRLGIVYNSIAYKMGLRTFDEIIKINGQDLRFWRDLEPFVKKQKFLTITVKRKSQLKTFTIKQKTSFASLGLEPAYFYIERIGPNTPAEQAGLKRGDRLVAINKKKIKNWKQVLDTVSSFSGKPFSLKYQRKNKIKTVLISPKILFVEGNIKKRFMLGIVSAGSEVLPKSNLRKRSVLQAFVYSGQETTKWLGFISTGLVRLIQGKISLRTMGGPVSIGRAAHSSFQQGFSSFLFMMALISLNLFFLNLLPIPMLDGGHILFFSLEGILGRPLSLNKLIVAQQIGFIVLISFFGFAFFNDIYNWLQAW